MKLIYLTCLFGLLMGRCYGQGYSLEQLHQGILAKYSKHPDSLNLCSQVVIDGVPYEAADIQSGRKKISPAETRVFVLGDLRSLAHSRCDYLLVIGKGKNQKGKEKRKFLKLARQQVKESAADLHMADEKCQSCMAIVVDGNLLREGEGKQRLQSLKVKDIAYIFFYDAPNPDYYGYRAKNGLMEIYLK